MKIDRLFIDETIDIDEEVSYLIGKLKIDPEPVDSNLQVYDYINRADDPISRGKKTLYIAENKGAVIRECPGTCNYTCCDYTILHSGTFCNMDCSYCILQVFFHPPVLQYFAGFNEIKKRLRHTFNQNKIFRIGTGEYTDSLIWEKVSLMPHKLVKMFSNQNNSILELKTKTVNIDSLLNIDHNHRTVISWSLNTPEIISSDEKGTASLTARLKAAQKAAAAGYKIGFHFDPVVIYPGCKDAYIKVIHKIFEYVLPEQIIWISIGTFRFIPKLKSIIENRFKDSTICYGEFITGLDNKMRYFKPLRIDIYKAMIDAFRKIAPSVLLYFCMEDEEVWEKCLGYFPEQEGELGYLLDKSVVEHCALDSIKL